MTGGAEHLGDAESTVAVAGMGDVCWVGQAAAQPMHAVAEGEKDALTQAGRRLLRFQQPCSAAVTGTSVRYNGE